MDFENTNTVSEIRDYNDVEPLLPDDFDATNENYDINAEPVDLDTPAEEAPTTEPPVETNEPAVQEPAVETEATTPQPGTAPVETPQPVVPQTIKVKFNHEERELSIDEAALLAQKGMNYDKLQERITAFENQNAKSDRLAKELGYKDSAEMMEAAEKNFVERQVQELIDAGNTEAMARFLVEQRLSKAKESIPAQETKPAEPAVDPRTQARNEEIHEFVRAYPGVTKLPDEVIAANKNGTRLLVAYERWKNQAALNELAILKQNQAAAAKAPVTGATGKASTNAKEQMDDPFIRGFDADDSWR